MSMIHCTCMHVCILSHLSRVWLFVTLSTVSRQAPLSMGSSRQEHWSGCHGKPVGRCWRVALLQHLPDPGIEPPSLMFSCTGRWFLNHLAALGKPEDWEEYDIINQECQAPLEAGKSKRGFILKVFGENITLLTSWFQISGFQNCGRITFYSFKSPSLCNLLQQP